MKCLLKNIQILNLITGITVQFFTALSGLVVPNLILNTYGSVLNGLVSTITQMMAYLSIVEMGIASASLVSLYKPMADNDHQRASAIFSAIDRFYQRIAAIFAIGSILCGILAMFFIKDDIPVSTIWFVVVALAGTNFVSYCFLSKYKVLLQADDKLYIINMTHIAGIMVQFILSILVIRSNANIALVKSVIVLTNLIEYLILFCYCRKRLPKITLRVSPAYDAIHQRKDVLVHQLLYLVLNNTDVLLLTIFTPSLVYVSIYTIYNMISTLIHNIVNTVIGMFSAEMGRSYALGRFDEVRGLLNKYEVVYDIALFGLYLSMAILIMPFISIYTKGITDAEYYDPIIGLLFSIYGITRMLRMPYFELTFSAGHFKQTKIQAVIEALTNLIVSIILLPTLGIAGVLIGSIVGEIYRTIHSYYYCYKSLLHFDWTRSLILGIANFSLFGGIYILMSRVRYTIVYSYLDFFALAVRSGLMIFISVILLNLASVKLYSKCKEAKGVMIDEWDSE